MFGKSVPFAKIAGGAAVGALMGSIGVVPFAVIGVVVALGVDDLDKELNGKK